MSGLKFLFVANTPRDPNKGASGCDLSMIEALRRLGHDVDEVWSSDMTPPRIRHGNLHQLLELPGRFANAVDEACKLKAYDVIQVNECHAYLAAMRHRKQGRPGIFINRSHGWEPAGRRALKTWASAMDNRRWWRKALTEALTPFLERHNRLVVEYSHGLVVCSRDDRDYIAAEYPEAKHRILPLAPGAPQSFVDDACKPMTPERSKRVLHVGQFHPAKAPEVVAEVGAKCIAANGEISFTWVCDGSHHQQAMALFPEPVRSRVRFLDWMPREELRAVYDAHGIFLFPSYTEGFSLTFLEAMSRGLRVVASRINGMKQVIEHDVNGVTFDRDDRCGMADCILSLCANDDAMVNISRSARNSVEQLTWQASATAYVAFCHQLLIHAK